MQEYTQLLQEVLNHGEARLDRTGVGTRALFAERMRFDLSRGFPLLTTKKVHWKSVREELLWFLRGESNVTSLRAAGVTIWDEWADEKGELGPIYGAQWRRWPSIHGPVDQIATLVEGLRKDPYGRRHILNAWNVGHLREMALPPCHMMAQFYVDNAHRLHCQMYQRSADMFLGVPFNIASYALLTHLLAQATWCEAGTLTIVLGDAHIYDNHVEQCQLLLSREPYPLPRLELHSAVEDIDDFRSEHIVLRDYQHHPAIAAPVAV